MHLFDVDALKKLILLLLSLHLSKYQDFIAAMKTMLDGDKTKGTEWKKNILARYFQDSTNRVKFPTNRKFLISCKEKQYGGKFPSFMGRKYSAEWTAAINTLEMAAKCRCSWPHICSLFNMVCI